ncbi:InlB B-repeat-containing protein [Candidatus Saccharibacteria bacterium]|nr:InlB B-repeat-containing protein [Candidatus Saccharibacteria bacterium]
MTKEKHTILAPIGLGLIVLTGAFLLSSVLSTYNTYAASYTLTLSSSGSQSIDVSNMGDKTAISADNLNVATNCRYGYNLTLSTSVNNNNLYLNGNSSNNTTGTYFSPVNGTSTLKSSSNTWGYYYNSSTPTTAPTSSSIFSPVPTLSNPATIKTPLTNPSSTDINDNFSIYYGVASSDDMPVGTYKLIPDTNNSGNDGTLVYNATISDSCISYTVHYNPSSYFEGNLITGTGTVADQTIYEGVSTPLTTSTYTGPNIGGVQYYFAGWNTAQDGSGSSYTLGQSVTDLTTVGSTITLYAMWTDCPSNNICYNANVTNASDVEGSMGNRSISNSTTSATLYAPNFKHDGYGFKSWNTKKDGTGTDYGPNQDISFATGQYSTGGLKLYATWVESQGNMQDWSGCSSMNIGDVTALKDTRDNDVYAVAKLADNKCWMIENLRLDDSVELSSTNTHNPSLPLTNIYDSSTTSNHLSPTSSLAYDATTAPEGWCTTDSSACDDQSRLRTDNTTLFTNNTSSSYSASSNVYSYGNYYNWYSATAGHGKYSKSSDNVAGDICPAGWHLPTGKDATGDFGVLDIALGGTGAYSSSSTTPTGATMSSAYRSYPNNFVYSGRVNGSSVGSRTSGGNYWSASASNSSINADILYFGSTFVNPGTNADNKYTGRMARCIACTYHFGISDCDDGESGGGQL